MTGQAGEHLEIVWIGVASRTIIPRVPARSDRKPGVGKMSLVPGCIRGPVTGFTGCRKSRGEVIWVPSPLVVCPVAPVAFPGCPLIDIILMAGRALQRGMDALEWKDAIVVDFCLAPIAVAGFVTKFTACRKSGGRVVRVSGLFVIGPMAAIAISRGSGVNPVLVTGAAVERRMDALQGKDGIVLNIGLIPAGVGRQMTELARCRKTRLNMVGFGRRLIILPVAGIAIKGGQMEIAVLVATVTAQIPVGGVERLPGLDGMVPAYSCPGNRPVAVLAISAERRPVDVVLAPDPVTVITAHGCSLINSV
jgi:hypothetical protein